MAADDLITQDGQIQWQDLLLGEETPFVGDQLTGWDDLPDLDVGTVAMPTQHGAWPGQLLAGVRELQWDFTVLPDDLAAFPDLVARLRAATTLRAQESDLVVQLAGARRLMRGRIIRRSLPADRRYTRGEPEGSLVWQCSDPRRYAVQEQSTWTALPSAEQGLAWDAPPAVGSLAWPLDVGTPGYMGTVTAYNGGDAATHPLVEIRGPIRRPSVAQLETGRVLEYDVALSESDVLTVDCRAGTVTLNAMASRLSTVTTRSTPEQAFAFEPGTTTLAFRAEPGFYDPLSTVTVRWRSAYW
ncbi:phage tail domain-containing protein [Streptomyces sp. MNP-20]|uniref:phage distal tail protein n=1 Tax=Streptomyces sp. MNP-20 TaxID=2721165 RepID=UPI002815049F|nr:phage tail domain-containing protein [Streptomyces sp. MNP-20]